MAEARTVIVDSANAAKVEAIRANCPTLEYGIVLGDPRPGWIDYDNAMATASEAFTPAVTCSDNLSLIYFTSGTTGVPNWSYLRRRRIPWRIC